jgi:hypothetical protein
VKILLALALVSSSAIAQNSAWTITDVKNNEHTIGYILHTHARGTSIKGPVNEKHVTGLRFICTSRNYTAMGEDKPVIAIFWQGLSGYGTYDINIKVDNLSIKLDKKWNQDNQILFQTINDSEKLLEALKAGKNFYAGWEVGSVKRSTAFDITGFESKYSEYTKLCDRK